LARTHYKLLCRVDGADVFLLWYTDDQDGVVVTPDERVLCFASEAALLQQAHALHIEVSEHRPVVHDLDAVQAFANAVDQRAREGGSASSPAPFDGRSLLLAWNFFGDVARSTPSRAGAFVQAEAHLDALYDKLFLASTPTPLARADASMASAWSSTEVERLAAVMRAGRALFRDSLVQVG
jgi:hypothetical protein